MIDFDKFAHPPGKLKHEFQTSAGFFGLLLVVSFLILIYIGPFNGLSGFFARKGNELPSHAASVHKVPFIKEEPIVVFSQRKVCSTLGQSQKEVGIYGEDGGHSAFKDGKSYFAYGDLKGANGNLILPNSVSVTTDTDASICMQFTSKSEERRAVALQPNLPQLSETTNWHLSWIDAEIEPGYLHFYYVAWRVVNGQLIHQGVGISKMNISDLSTQRLGNCGSKTTCYLENENTNPTNGKVLGGVNTYVEGEFLYLFREIFENHKQLGFGLSRIKISDIVNYNLNDYQYWNGTTFVPNISEIIPLWEGPGKISSDNEGNPVYDKYHGIDVSYNQFLQKFVATYHTGVLSIVASRTADNLIGPWSNEVNLIICPDYVTGNNSFFCYGGAQHPQFFKNNGQVIYQTYSNGDLYQAFMHEIVLGSPIYQFENNIGQTAYLEKTASIPEGFSQTGLAFYASKNPLNNYMPIHEWFAQNTGDRIYSSKTPGENYRDLGVRFYAPVEKTAGLAEIHRFDKTGNIHIYSALDLTSDGFVDAGVAFYAKITSYLVDNQDKFYPKTSDNFYELKLSTPSARITGANFNKLKAQDSYAILGCGQLTNCDAINPNKSLIPANDQGEISTNANYTFIGYLKLLVAKQAENQALLPLPQASGAKGFIFGQLLPNSQYNLTFCAITCSQDPAPVTYNLKTTRQGKLGIGTLRPQPPKIEPVENITIAPQNLLDIKLKTTDPNSDPLFWKILDLPDVNLDDYIDRKDVDQIEDIINGRQVTAEIKSRADINFDKTVNNLDLNLANISLPMRTAHGFFQISTGKILWQTKNTDTGIYKIIFNVTDGDFDVSEDFNIVVNIPPVITLHDPDIPTGSNLIEDGIIGVADIAKINSLFGKNEVTNATDWNNLKTYDLNFDGSISTVDISLIVSAFGTFNWPPVNANDRPVMLQANKLYQFYLSATDPDSTNLPTITASGTPPNAIFTSEDFTTVGGKKIKRAKFSWTPTSAQKGQSFTLVFKADDGQCSLSCPAKTLFVKVI